MALGDFFDGLSALKFLEAGVSVYSAKEGAKAKAIEAQTKQHENVQRAAVEAAKLQQQQQMTAAEMARRTFNNEQMWKLASWFTMAVSASLVGAVIIKILNSDVKD